MPEQLTRLSNWIADRQVDLHREHDTHPRGSRDRRECRVAINVLRCVTDQIKQLEDKS